MSKIADTYNEYGTPVTMFCCNCCGDNFTVCPAVADCDLDQWLGCQAEACDSYDPSRDADKLFEQGRVHRVGDRSHIHVVRTGEGEE